MSPDQTVTNLVFLPGAWKPPAGTVRKVMFRNVAFSRSTLSRITFTDCAFEDCLFLGTKFTEVEFHGCTFLNCNFWKARFKQVYLDPGCITLEHRFKIEAANAGISLFQALLSNFADERQDKFFMATDMCFRRWKRYQLYHDLRRKHLRPCQVCWRWISSITYEGLAGFGYRPLRFFCATLLLFFAVSYLNYQVIGNAVQIGGVEGSHVSFVDAVFYTFSILTVLGFSTVVPVTVAAKLLTVLEALASIGWLGIFTAVLVKRFLR